MRMLSWWMRSFEPFCAIDYNGETKLFTSFCIKADKKRPRQRFRHTMLLKSHVKVSTSVSSTMKFSYVVVVLPVLVNASSGDRRPDFIGCVAHCTSIRCPNSSAQLAESLPLRLTGWTCLDECRYDCIHQLTTDDQVNGRPTHQYFGKWPFWRLGGIQEPASVLFSLFNMSVHIQGAKKIIYRVPHQHPMRLYYLAWSLTSINAWIWSSVFHTRGK